MKFIECYFLLIGICNNNRLLTEPFNVNVVLIAESCISQMTSQFFKNPIDSTAIFVLFHKKQLAKLFLVFFVLNTVF